SRAGGLNGIATARCRGEGPTFRAAKCAHLGASAQGRLRRPSDRYHAARPGDSKSQEAAQRDLREAYWPAAAEDRRGAGARFFYDGRDGQGFRLSRQGNRSSAGDTTACSRVLNGHCTWLSPRLEVFTIVEGMSALPPKTDMVQQDRDVCLVPKADILRSSKEGRYSITSSASCWSLSGTSRPSVLAVLRLMTSSNLVGCSTGNSAGLAPCMTLATIWPVCHHIRARLGP